MKKPNRSPLAAVTLWLLAACAIYNSFFLMHGRALSFTFGVIGGVLIVFAILFSDLAIARH